MASPYPPLPATSSELSIEGFTLGHGSDFSGMTGVTVVLCPDGAVAAAEVRGSSTGTRQFDALVGAHAPTIEVHAVVLAGGSAFGLSAADAVTDHLAAANRGLQTGYGPVPRVPTAILFDLAFGDSRARPHRSLAEEALAAASTGAIPMGSIGVGTGATVGKCLGPERAMKGGFGFVALETPGRAKVAAAVAVNAFGDVVDPGSGRTLAGCRAEPGASELADARRVLASLPSGSRHPWEGNTTLAVVMTDALLERGPLLKVCQMAFGGFYRALAPALSLYDGDLVVTLASGQRAAHPHQVGVLAEEAVARAIVAAVKAADGFGLLPAARDLLSAAPGAAPPPESDEPRAK
jgi:L-aminopeptidase/D-esterase-like protein